MRVRSTVAFRCAASLQYGALKAVASCSSALQAQCRWFARPSPTQGTIPPPPHGGFVSPDVKVDMDTQTGGAFARGLFAKRDIGYDREIMFVPAFSFYVSDYPVPSSAREVITAAAEAFTASISSAGEGVGGGGQPAPVSAERRSASLSSVVAIINRFRQGSQQTSNGTGDEIVSASKGRSDAEQATNRQQARGGWGRTGRLSGTSMYTPNTIFTSSEEKKLKQQYHAHIREMVLEVTKDIFSKLVLTGNTGGATASGSSKGGVPGSLRKEEEIKQYIRQRVLTMMSGGFSYFTCEDDVIEFASQVRAPGPEGVLLNGRTYLFSGEFSSYDLQKLPLMIEFNRFDVVYNGRLGICLFPEAQYFNHLCQPNVKLDIRFNVEKQNFYLSARTLRPIQEGEGLFIDYMPANTLPLSRLALAMKRRWGFECTCDRCKSRGIAAVTLLFVVVMIPMAYSLRTFSANRSLEKQRGV